MSARYSRHSRVSFLVLVMIFMSLFNWLPGTMTVASASQVQQTASAANNSGTAPPLPATEQVKVAPLTSAKLPSLVLGLETTPAVLKPGATATLVLNVTNQSPEAAQEVTINLPLPASASIKPLTGENLTLTKDGWLATLPEIKGNSTAKLTATFQVEQVPAGQAVVFQAKVSAKNLPAALTKKGGALVVAPTTQNSKSLALTGGETAKLSNSTQTNSVALDVPAALGKQVATLKISGLDTPAKLAAKLAPAGFYNGFAPFQLEALAADGKALAALEQPVTVKVSYTPEQLDALGISENNLALFALDSTTGTWSALPTKLDTENRTVSALTTQATTMALADFTVPSESYIPSLQGFQTSLFTGAASYSFQLETPAGPGGLNPGLALSYNSSGSDGKGGTGTKQQTSWVGRDWSLDTGSVALNKLTINGGTNRFVNTYSVVFNGVSANLVRGAALIANADPEDPTQWDWRPTAENFIRVRAITNGLSYPPNAGTGDKGRGGYTTKSDNNGGVITEWKPRHIWQVWTKDGTRYDFSEDLWYGWDRCAFATSVDVEAYKWQLTSVTDTHGNTMQYKYARQTYDGPNVYCGAGRGGELVADVASWPTEITWAGGRYRVEFVSEPRTQDTDFGYSPFQYGEQYGTPRETRVLNAVKVWSNPTGTAGAPVWQLVRQYTMFDQRVAGYQRSQQDYILYSDNRICSQTTNLCQADTTAPKLALRAFTRVGKDGTTAVLPTTFSYSNNWGTRTGNTVGGWNRLIKVDNNQGGVLNITYDHIQDSVNNNTFFNRHRVVAKSTSDGQGQIANATYSYGTPAYNTLGTNLGGNSLQANPNSAVLYYNKFWDPYHPNTHWLAQQPESEFRGHNKVTETDHFGNKTEHWFYQGDNPDNLCTPTAQGTASGASHGIVTADPCFDTLHNYEPLKGREYKIKTFASGAANPLTERIATFKVDFTADSYGTDPLTGLWRSFTYQSQSENKNWESGTVNPVIRKTVFEYDPANQQGSIQYGNPSTIKEYDGAGNLYRQTSRAYNSLVDAQSYIVDRVWQEVIRDGQSRALALTMNFYDQQNTTVRGMSAKGDLSRVSKYYNVPLLASLDGITVNSYDTTYEYDSYGNVTKFVNYDGAGSRLRNTDGTWIISQPGNGSTPRPTTMTYDPTYHVFTTKVVQPAVNGVSLEKNTDYDWRMGLPTSESDANNNPTLTEYDAMGRLIKVAKPGDSLAVPTVQAYYYDTLLPFQYIICLREVSGQGGCRPIQKFYDGLGRLIQEKSESLDGTQNIVVDKGYDQLGRLIKTSQPRHRNETPADTFFKYTAPAGGVLWNTISYDALNRPRFLTSADGSRSEHQYGVYLVDNVPISFDNVIDANRHRIQYRYDNFQRLQQVMEWVGDCANGSGTYECTGSYTTPWAGYSYTSYSYNPLDLLTQVKDAKNNLTTNTYDSLGRKVAMSDPDMGNFSYKYDVNGNLTEQTDAKSQTIFFAYDALSRLASKTFPGGTQSLFRYDEAGVPNGKGQRTSATNPNETTNWQYDARGNITRATHALTGVSGNRVFQWGYDSADRITSVTYPNNEVASYTYDAAWRPASVCSSLGGCYATSASYDQADQLKQLTLGNGLTETRNYDSTTQRLSQIAVSGGAVNLSYTYDKVGNIKTLTNALMSGGSQTQNFNYDHRDRLTQAWTTGSTTASYNESYAYDQIGNFTSKAGVNYTYSAAGSPRPHTPISVGSTSYGYDNNGNLTTAGEWTYTWNAENQLVQASKPAPVSGGCGTLTPQSNPKAAATPAVGGETLAPQALALMTACPDSVKSQAVVAAASTLNEKYYYDAFGSRVKKISFDGTTTIYLEGRYEEIPATGSYKTYYSFNGSPVAMRDNTGAVSYLHGDQLGSVSVVTNASGQINSRQEFDPWGKVRNGSSPTTVNYTGQRLDTDTGLLYYNARYYNPVSGRFLSADTLVGDFNTKASVGALSVAFHEESFLRAVNSENSFTRDKGFNFQLDQQDRKAAKISRGPTNPQTLNRYSYVNNNPVRYVDPTGHDIEIVFDGFLTLNEAQAVVNWLDSLETSVENFIVDVDNLIKALEALKEDMLDSSSINNRIGAVFAGIGVILGNVPHPVAQGLGVVAGIGAAAAWWSATDDSDTARDIDKSIAKLKELKARLEASLQKIRKMKTALLGSIAGAKAGGAKPNDRVIHVRISFYPNGRARVEIAGSVTWFP